MLWPKKSLARCNSKIVKNKNHISSVTAIRKTLREQRKSLPLISQQRASAIIAAKIINSKIFQASKTIGLYLPSEGEVITNAIMQAAWNNKKTCYLPYLISTSTKVFAFVAHQELEPLFHNKYGILEPAYNANKVINAQKLDLVIVPLVAFNEKCFRLGRGGGFYDKAFAYKIKCPQCKPFLLGVAYGFQQANFESQEWDIPMQLIVTEKQSFTRCSAPVHASLQSKLSNSRRQR
jgi:5-formyltetrahydrofolate cyclo-ligase